MFSHRIEPESSQTPQAVRYSLTFRCVSRSFSNSICLIGDSNFRDIEFGAGRGKVGETYPGKRVYAPLIEDIDPLVGAAYSNIVIGVGINNIKHKGVNHFRDIEHIYEQYKQKIYEINNINPTAKIFVFPLLPTGSELLNVKVMDFNHLLSSNLPQWCCNVSIISGVVGFLESPNKNVLKRRLTKRPGDILHINATGRGLLVRLMKQALYSRRRGFVDGRSYSSAIKVGEKVDKETL